MKQVAFIGAGAIGTSLGNVLAEKGSVNVILHSIEQDVVEDINNTHINSRYFPTLRLSRNLRATTDDRALSESGVIFLAVPSVVLVEYILKIREFIDPSSLLVNLATDSTGSSLSGWGWQNGAYWVSQSTTVTFPTTGSHTLRIQVREDGVQFDQIVLGPNTYLSVAPGSVSNDSTIVAK